MSFLKQPFSDGCWVQKEKNNSDEASPRGREREKWKGRGANFKYRCGPGGRGSAVAAAAPSDCLQQLPKNGEWRLSLRGVEPT